MVAAFIGAISTEDSAIHHENERAAIDTLNPSR